jgi:hypothetical protein
MSDAEIRELVADFCAAKWIILSSQQREQGESVGVSREVERARLIALSAMDGGTSRSNMKHRDSLLRAASYLGCINHNIAFIGDLGVGWCSLEIVVDKSA